MFAPKYHPAMRHAAGPRREIGVRTVFNILGPLTNPAHAGHQLVGVPRPDLVETIARVLGELGAKRAIVVHGADGLDEIALSGPSIMAEYRDGSVTLNEITPGQFGLTHAGVDQLRSTDVETSHRILSNVLNGAPGPYRDIVLINAAAALVAGEAADNLAEGLQTARESIDSGAARDRLERLVEASRD